MKNLFLSIQSLHKSPTNSPELHAEMQRVMTSSDSNETGFSPAATQLFNDCNGHHRSTGQQLLMRPLLPQLPVAAAAVNGDCCNQFNYFEFSDEGSLQEQRWRTADICRQPKQLNPLSNLKSIQEPTFTVIGANQLREWL